ncbi:MAG: hypothetical protein ACI4LT_00940 [Treponema sp.]
MKLYLINDVISIKIIMFKNDVNAVCINNKKIQQRRKLHRINSTPCNAKIRDYGEIASIAGLQHT